MKIAMKCRMPACHMPVSSCPASPPPLSCSKKKKKNVLWQHIVENGIDHSAVADLGRGGGGGGGGGSEPTLSSALYLKNSIADWLLQYK